MFTYCICWFGGHESRNRDHQQANTIGNSKADRRRVNEKACKGFARPNVVSWYSSKPRVDDWSDSFVIIKFVSQLCKSSVMGSGKSFPTWIGQAKERLCGGRRNNRAPRVARKIRQLKVWLFQIETLQTNTNRKLRTHPVHWLKVFGWGSEFRQAPPSQSLRRKYTYYPSGWYDPAEPANFGRQIIAEAFVGSSHVFPLEWSVNIDLWKTTRRGM